MSHSITVNKKFIVRIISSGIRATIRSIIAREISVGLFNFISVLRFMNNDSFKLHYVLKHNHSLYRIVYNLERELGVKFNVVDNMTQCGPHDINWNSSVGAIAISILRQIEHSDPKPPGAE